MNDDDDVVMSSFNHHLQQQLESNSCSLNKSNGNNNNNNNNKEDEAEEDKKDNDYIFLDAFGFKYNRKINGELIEYLKKTQDNDSTIVTDEWNQFIHNKCHGDINNLKRFEHDRSFLELLNGGIASSHRKNIWLVFLDSIVLDDFKKAHYHKLLKDELPQRNYKTEISLDLERTFPYHILAQDQDFKDKIYRVLLVYSINNPSVGYCQSLNYITFILLLIIDNEEQAFWCLNSIAEKILPQYFTHTMLDAQIDQQVFYDLMQEMFPELTAHFTGIGVIIQIITIEWFLCLFSTILPAQYALIIWDNVFVRGSKVLLEVGLALIEANIDALMLAKSHAQVVNILSFKTNPAKLYDTIASSQKRIGIVISRKKIQDLKLKHWQITKKQVKESADQKDLKYLMKYTSFSLTKLKGLKEEFDVLSHDGTGIGYLQFHQIILRFLPDWKDAEQEGSGRELNRLLEKMFEAMDEDGDRILNFKELVKGITILSHGSFDQKLRLIFKSFAVENKTFMTKAEVKSMIDHVHCIFYKNHYKTLPTEVTDELKKHTDEFLEAVEEHTTFEGLKKLSQEFPLILESFQTPDHTSEVTDYTITSGSAPPLKRRSNSFHLLDDDRLFIKDKEKETLISNNINNNHHHHQNCTDTQNNNNNNKDFQQLIRKITPEPLIKTIHQLRSPPAPSLIGNSNNNNNNNSSLFSTPKKQQQQHEPQTPSTPVLQFFLTPKKQQQQQQQQHHHHHHPPLTPVSQNRSSFPPTTPKSSNNIIPPNSPMSPSRVNLSEVIDDKPCIIM